MVSRTFLFAKMTNDTILCFSEFARFCHVDPWTESFLDADPVGLVSSTKLPYLCGKFFDSDHDDVG